MKKLFYLLIILVVAFVVYEKVNTKPVVNENIKTYRNSKIGLSFSYPKILSASTTADVVTLHHEIPYKNKGDCDMMGDEKTYDNLTDFKVSFEVSNKNLVETMKEKSPYIPKENFVDDIVVESPGFIDKYNIGNLDGFAIYEGAEGCGQTTYYFPIEKNKTLFITKMSIQILSGVANEEKAKEVLKVPGVISRTESDEIFQKILLTLKTS